MRVRVKICGITSVEDARLAVEAGADALGFIFAPSKRQVTPQEAAAIVGEVPPFVTTVGVVVNQDVPAILRVCPLDAVQFHGQETPEEMARVQGVRRIKALRVQQLTAELAELERTIRTAGRRPAAADVLQGHLEEQIRSLVKDLCRYGEVADGFLLDTYAEGQEGGTGQTFPWAVAAGARQCGRSIMVAGGLTADNVEHAIWQARPDAVDVSSGVEVGPGKKDPWKLRAFIEKVTQASGRCTRADHDQGFWERVRPVKSFGNE